MKVELLDNSQLDIIEYNLDVLEYITLVQVLSLSNDGAVQLRDFYIYVEDPPFR
ncbi:hypothetical protein [Stygiolobus caldivivus]|uniref:Uncharacterized protein n=1 Tax=Stygiolobus caldivivus TaxID=2824673 RepID=A0A8D5U490_9CREN|nr:hypothetical protein [Stygiolobus caldivivus]BCU68967.1 hypothetical protein KN1_02640 [Stygiolobus caldivivus]